MENEKLNATLEELWDSLTDEQKEKARACKSLDELMKLAGEEKIELPDDMLKAVSGGMQVVQQVGMGGEKPDSQCGI